MRHAFAPISGRMVYFFRGMANNNDKIGHPSLLSIGRADTYREPLTVRRVDSSRVDILQVASCSLHTYTFDAITRSSSDV